MHVLSILAMIAVATIVVGGALAGLVHVVRRIDPPDEHGPDTDDDRGGGTDRRPDPRPRGGGGDPLWWPEFEREFASYVAAMDARAGTPSGPPNARATKRPVCVLARGPRPRAGARLALKVRRARLRRRRGCVA